MDERYRNLERQALSDPAALQKFRRLALTIDRIPEPVIRVLAGYGYQPARDLIPRRQWPNSTGTAFELLFEGIPHNAHTAALIRYRVLAPAAERLIRDPEVIEALEDISEDATWDFQLRDRSPLRAIQDALGLLRLMTQEAYYDDLCVRSSRDYIQDQSRTPLGNFYPTDPLVQQHNQAKKDCEAVGHLLQDSPDSPHITHLPRAIFALGDTVSPKLAGFEGVYNLDQMLHGIRYFLDGMDYSWSNNAHIEAIFSYYLI